MNTSNSKKIEATILVVDDDDLFLDVVADVLEQYFSKVIKLVEGKKTLEIIAQETVDLLVIDYRMPQITGLEVIQSVKEKYPTLPCLMVTGNASDSEVMKKLRNLPFEVIDKPFRNEFLVHRVQSELLKCMLIRALEETRYMGLSKEAYQQFSRLSALEQIQFLTQKIKAA